MKTNVTFVLQVFFCAFISAQVGIGTLNPEASAVLDVRSTINETNNSYGGMLIPRVSLNSEGNATSPVLNPPDGTLIYNKTISEAENLKTGIYYWDANVSNWARGSFYRETPKTSVVKFSGSDTDYFILNGYGNGYSDGIGTVECLYDNYIFDPTADYLGIKKLHATNPTSGKEYNYIGIAPGKYSVEVSVSLKGAPCGTSITCNYVAEDYYYMGHLIDFYVGSYVSETDYTVIQKFRKEDGVLSKINQRFRITEYFTFEVPDDGTEHFIHAKIGRMTGTSFQGGLYVIPSDTYIKLNKF